MKKFLHLAFLAIALTLGVANTAFAQPNVIENKKPCPYTVKINFGDPLCMATEATQTVVTVPGNSLVGVAGPPNKVMSIVSGSPNPAAIGCNFTIKRRCTGGVGVLLVTCPGPCGPNYKVSLVNNKLTIF